MKAFAVAFLFDLADALALPGCAVLRLALALRSTWLTRAGVCLVKLGRAPARLAWALFPSECAAL